MKTKNFTYPFTALVGQEKLKKALLLNVVNPRLGGVLVRGEKGTAKSTAVRALAALLPEIQVVEGCPYSCAPEKPGEFCRQCRELERQGKIKKVFRRVWVVDLPVSATEDRLVGSLDFEHAVKYGVPRFEPGLLARAHRGFLYVDEVNLLDDHLVDSLLDAAAMGINTVEREGISYSHPAAFVLVGTMNPEEGELRPQLVDRFGFCVPVEGVLEPEKRVEIIRRREEFDARPLEFLQQWEAEQQDLKDKILAARNNLNQVTISEEMLELISKLSLESFTAGHRADILMAAGACTIASWEGRTEAGERDVYEAAELVLFHRTREAPPPPPEEPYQSEQDPPEEENQEQNQEEETPEQPEEQEQQGEENRREEESRKEEDQPRDSEEEQREDDSQEEQPLSLEEMIFSVGEPFPVRRISAQKDRALRKGSGRRSRTRSASRAGRYVRSTMERKNNDLAFDATMRAASPFQKSRQKKGVAIAIEPGDIREKVREKRIGNFILFVVDASGSMGAQQRMTESKGAVLSLLLDAYQKRDRIGMVAFKGEGAELLLPPTSSVERAEKLLVEMPTGGKTPLSAGLARAYEVAKSHLYRDPNISPMMIIISDGKANVSMGQDKPLAEVRRMAEYISQDERIKTLVIDVEKPGFLSFGLARDLAGYLEGDYYRIDDLKADTLLQAVQNSQVL